MGNRPFHPKTPPSLLRPCPEPRRAFVLSLTDRCNIACDFCCHPYANSEIPSDEACRLVAEALELDYAEIAVTGGEPLLKKELVLSLARMCQKKGQCFGLITNAFWARTMAKASYWAAEFREAGVTRVTVSWDPSHGAFIPPSAAQNAIDACVNEGLKVTLTGGFKDSTDTHLNYGIKTAHLSIYRNFRLHETCVSPAGNGEMLDIDEYHLAKEDMNDSAIRCPAKFINEIVLYAQDGLVQPCCSVYAGYKTKYLSLGDWRTQSIRDLDAMHRSDAFFWIIREGGFRRIYEIVEQLDPGLFETLPEPSKFRSPCHLCAHLMSSEAGARMRSVADKHLARRVREIISLLPPSLSRTTVDT